LLIEVFMLPHYLAPFTAAFYALGLQAMRHLRVWSPNRRPVGLAMVRLTVALCVLLAGGRLVAEQVHLDLGGWPSIAWYGSSDRGVVRARVDEQLQHLPGKQLAIVRYKPEHDPRIEWVYNTADIDHSKVIWARETDEADMQPLLRYYNDRNVWLVQPDSSASVLIPYTVGAGQRPSEP
jgi:hypothetical protein